ncbi:MAG: hypothetical protein JWM69_190, partial [Candidatus Binatus sp.]|nr:hypothetical protein [Candidatus Binatus sp.]
MSEQPDMNLEAESPRDTGAILILNAWSERVDGRAIPHGFVGRQGGISEGRFASLNLSHWVGDQKEAVDKNWARLIQEVPELKTVARINQVHAAKVAIVTRESAALRPAADGMVTADAGVMLGVMSADCVPILMFDARRRIAGAIHAGWRGIIAGIADAGVVAMRSLGADSTDIRAALGPAIGPCCFEVDQTLGDRFEAEIEGAAQHVREGRPGKAYIDLRAILRDQLTRAGLPPDNVENVGPCTRCASEQFFSRRAAGGATTG